jgi:hypothetical protein
MGAQIASKPHPLSQNGAGRQQSHIPKASKKTSTRQSKYTVLICRLAKSDLHNCYGLLSRDSPDESQTGINVRVFPALLQDRREVLTATSTSGDPNAWSRV